MYDLCLAFMLFHVMSQPGSQCRLLPTIVGAFYRSSLPDVDAARTMAKSWLNLAYICLRIAWLSFSYISIKIVMGIYST